LLEQVRLTPTLTLPRIAGEGNELLLPRIAGEGNDLLLPREAGE